MKSKVLFILIILFFAAVLLIYIQNLAYGNIQKNTDEIPPYTLNSENALTDTQPGSRSLSSSGQSINCDLDYNFYDEFDNELNTKYWTAVNQEQKYNEELQQYTEDNVHVSEGCLVLRADIQENEYYSGLVSTQNKIEFKYGTVEVRMKYPKGKSFFPAIWMLPSDYSPFPEIDIMEVLGCRPDKLYFVYHYYNHEHKRSYSSCYIKNYDVFHTYRLDWQPDSLCWYVDNRLVHSTRKNIPHKKMYLIINLAVGGEWPGFPDEYTVFPSEILVDYVKIIPYRQNEREFANDTY